MFSNLTMAGFVIGLVMLINYGLNIFIHQKYHSQNHQVKTVNGAIGIYILSLINLFIWALIPIAILYLVLY